MAERSAAREAAAERAKRSGRVLRARKDPKAHRPISALLKWCSGSNPRIRKRKGTGLHEVPEKSKPVDPRHSPRRAVLTSEDLAKVVLAWAKLPTSIRAAILALVDAAKGDHAT